MKKHLLLSARTTIATAALFSLLLTSAAQAINPASLIPASTTMTMTLDTTADNPMEDLFINIFGGNLSSETELDSSTLENLIKNTVLTMAINMADPEEQPDTCYMIKTDSATFNQLLSDKATTEQKDYQGKTIYLTGETFTSFIDDQAITCTTEQQIKTVIDNYTSNSGSLSANSSYSFVNSKIDNQAFFRLFMNLENFDTQIGPMLFPATQTIIKALKSEAISIAQKSNGFTMKLAIQGDEAKLKELDMLFNKSLNTPSLYKTITGTNLIVYGEEKVDKNWYKNIITSLTPDGKETAEIKEAKAEMKTETGIDFDTEIDGVFYGQEMFTMHQQESLWPGITYTLKVPQENQAKAALVLKKLNTWMTENKDSNDITVSTEIINGTTYYKYEIDTRSQSIKEDGADSMLAKATTAAAKITLRFGIAQDGTLIVSTLSDLAAALNSSSTIETNSTVQKTLGTLNSEVAGIGFMDIDQLNDYVVYALQEIGAEKELQNAAKATMEPFHAIYYKAEATSDSAWFTMDINLDTAKLLTLGDKFSDLSVAMQQSELTPYRGYCDVNKSDWYYNHVKKLSKMEVVSGYYENDGGSFLYTPCFKPGKNVTRAEFLKMTIVAAEKAGYELPTYDNNEGAAGNPATFSDYDENSYAWYNTYLDQAVTNGIIDGYSDKTLRPNAQITRAEAVKILMVMKNDHHNSVSSMLNEQFIFNDVKSSDWFGLYVYDAKQLNLISGTSNGNFEPNRTLTRAEAAKIIANFYDLETK